MSSVTDIASLSALAEAVQEVDAAMKSPTEDMTRERFTHLQDRINALQTACPNHEGVVEARVWWYKLGLGSFEKYVVCAVEQGRPWPFRTHPAFVQEDDHDKRVLCGTNLLEHFMRRSYLKRSFPFLYPRLLSCYQRMIDVRVPGLFEDEIKKHFTNAKSFLERGLLEGTL